MTIHKGTWDFSNDQMAVPTLDKQKEICHTIMVDSKEAALIVGIIQHCIRHADYETSNEEQKVLDRLKNIC